MLDSDPKWPTTQQRYWGMAFLIVVVAGVLWFAAPWETAKKAPPAEPVARSTDWAVEPTGPAVPVNLPKTQMTNVPNKTP